MPHKRVPIVSTGPRREPCRRAAAFSLVELLTVVFIISLLIGILIPSINSARNAAKRATTAKTLQSLKVGLEMFKNDNGADFRQTNGYPPSFSHPTIPGYTFQAYEGEFPFLPNSANAKPKVYGAHWLPAMLMGVDNLGYIPRRSIPNKDNLRVEPWLWYAPDPLGDGRPLQERTLYIDPSGVPTKATKDLPGRPNLDLFPGWDVGAGRMKMKDLPVIVDAFDQPILYYVANTHGRVTNLVSYEHNATNTYSGGDQETGIPFYFHEDNEGFTGDGDEDEAGWNFGGRQRPHPIAWSGALMTAQELRAVVSDADPDRRMPFARYILDRNIWSSMLGETPPPRTLPLRPVNADSYLLISAGPDGLYGTNDDVTNMPPWPE